MPIIEIEGCSDELKQKILDKMAKVQLVPAWNSHYAEIPVAKCSFCHEVKELYRKGTCRKCFGDGHI